MKHRLNLTLRLASHDGDKSCVNKGPGPRAWGPRIIIRQSLCIILDRTGPVRSVVDRSGPEWTDAARFDSVLFGRDQTKVPVRSVSVRTGPVRIRSIRTGPVLVGSVRFGPVLVGSVRFGPPVRIRDLVLAWILVLGLGLGSWSWV